MLRVDMHCHWIPPELVEQLAARQRPPRIDGGELQLYRTRLPFGSDYFDVDERLAFMDQNGVSMQVLSLPGLFGVDSLPVEEAAPLTRIFNDALVQLCQEHHDRFGGMAALPLADTELACAELQLASGEGLIGAILPADGFVSRQRADEMASLFAIGHTNGLHFFVHPGPWPEDLTEQGLPTQAPYTDCAEERRATVHTQSRLSDTAVTLCLSGFLEPYSDATVQIANIGGGLALWLERMDHISLHRRPDEPPPSARMSPVFVDISTFGPRGIRAAVDCFGADHVLFGTDHPVFSTRQMSEALAQAGLSGKELLALSSGNAQRIFTGEPT